MTTMPCDKCDGKGLVSRSDANPLEHRPNEVCTKCAGAGAVPYKPPRSLPETGLPDFCGWRPEAGAFC